MIKHNQRTHAWKHNRSACDKCDKGSAAVRRSRRKAERAYLCRGPDKDCLSSGLDDEVYNRSSTHWCSTTADFWSPASPWQTCAGSCFSRPAWQVTMASPRLSPLGESDQTHEPKCRWERWDQKPCFVCPSGFVASEDGHGSIADISSPCEFCSRSERSTGGLQSRRACKGNACQQCNQQRGTQLSEYAPKSCLC